MWWSWVLTAVGVTGLYLAGRKVWWAWLIGLGAQLLWMAYALSTQQYGFLVSAVAYGWVYATNARKWRAVDAAPQDEPSRDRNAPLDKFDPVEAAAPVFTVGQRVRFVRASKASGDWLVGRVGTLDRDAFISEDEGWFRLVCDDGNGARVHADELEPITGDNA